MEQRAMPIENTVNRPGLKILLLCLIISGITLSLFHISKSRNSGLYSYDQYFFTSELEQIQNTKGIVELKNFDLNSVILSYARNTFVFMNLLPFLLSFIYVILIYILLHKAIKNRTQIFLSICFLILSPMHLYIFGSFNNIFLPLIFILLGLLFLVEFKYLLSVIAFLSAFFLNLNFIIAILIILLISYQKLKGERKLPYIIAIIISSFAFALSNKYRFGLNISFHSFLTNYIADFGAFSGIGAFTIIVAFLGFIVSWRNKKENVIIYFAAACLMVLSLYDESLIIFVDLILCYYAGLGLYSIIKRKWESDTLKNHVIILIVCGLIFSSGSFIKKTSFDGPKFPEIISLEWLKEMKPSGIVLSHYDYGFFIKSISANSAYTDKKYFQVSRDKLKIRLGDYIFKSRDLKNVTNFFDKNEIRYIWINKDMMHGKVWNEPDDGLLLLIKNSDEFKKIYDYQNVNIFEYTGFKKLASVVS